MGKFAFPPLTWTDTRPSLKFTALKLSFGTESRSNSESDSLSFSQLDTFESETAERELDELFEDELDELFDVLELRLLEQDEEL